MIYIFNYASPFGNIRLTSDGEFLTNARTEFWQGRADNKGLCPKGERETDGSSLPATGGEMAGHLFRRQYPGFSAAA